MYFHYQYVKQVAALRRIIENGHLFRKSKGSKKLESSEAESRVGLPIYLDCKVSDTICYSPKSSLEIYKCLNNLNAQDN